MKHIKTLDGFRAFAVLLVIVAHWLSLYAFVGAAGVTMFYVLSGFLITTILLDSREKIFEKKSTIGHVLKTFYVRRTLRIFPVYYLFILLLFFFYPIVFRYYHNVIYWCIFYASNIYVYCHQQFIGILNHTWSLAVEEQFYLLWPWVIIFTRRKSLPLVMYCFLAGAVFIRIGFELLQPQLSTVGMYVLLTPTCFDAFAIGGLMALYRFEKTYFVEFGKWIKRLALVSLPLFALTFFNHSISNVLLRLTLAVPSAALIYILLDVPPGIMESLFSNPVFTYLGKISYGLYLWHNPFPTVYPVLSAFLYKKGLVIPFTNYCILPFVGGGKQNIIYFIVLVIVSTASWFLFEKPINNLKSKFTYNN